MTREDVLDKVRKLLALASNKGATPDEAATAAARAAEIMARHEVEEAELEAGGRSTEPREAVGEADLEELRRADAWRGALAHAVCKAHGCEVYLANRRDLFHGTRTCAIRVVGKPTQTAAVKVLYGFLSREIERLAVGRCASRRETWVNGRTWANSFRLGCVSAIRDRLQAQTRAEEQARRETVSCTALAVIDRGRQEIEQYVEKLDLRSSGGRTNRVTQAGWNAGHEAGSRMHLGASLGAGGQRKLTGV